MSKFSRRTFMAGCSAAIAALAGSRMGTVAFGRAEEEPYQNILVVLFLRGGCDGLSCVPIIDGVDRRYYEENRTNLAVPASGEGSAIALDDRFGLHPAAAPLAELYQEGRLAVVHAAGLTSDTRSHFDAMRYMELGTPNSKSSTTGWLARHLQTVDGGVEDLLMPALSVGALQPTSLGGSRKAIGMTKPDDFEFGGQRAYSDWQRQMLRGMYAGTTPLHEAGIQTLDAIDILEYGNPGRYTPAPGADYPGGAFGDNLMTVAQMIKMQLGLRVATVDLGGWDTHEYQGNQGRGYFADLLGRMAQGLHAFYTDLQGTGGRDATQNANQNTKRVTTVVMSEFGRSLKENGSRGTDHGHGNIMLVLGDQVNGGKVYGEWPGLAPEQLYDRRDLQITTDYRRVLSEILSQQLGNQHLDLVFPGYNYAGPLNVMKGSSLESTAVKTAST